MQNLKFFDASAKIGAPQNGLPAYAATTGELLAEMDYHGVERALVCHINAGGCGAEYANRALAEFLAADTALRLTGVWTILPACTRELPQGEALFQQMKTQRIGALNIMPVEHGWILSRLSIGKQIEEAVERRIPFIFHAPLWESIYTFMSLFPNARVICSSGGLWGTDRYFRPLLENYENFFLELSTYWVPEGIADLAREYGAHRLLYGSGYPSYGHGSMMLALRQADLPAEDKVGIAGKNLERLLEEVQG